VMYADDIALFAEGPRELGRMVQRCEDILRRVFLRFSGEKSKVMVFHMRKPVEDVGYLQMVEEAKRDGEWATLGGGEVEEGECFKNLGIDLVGWDVEEERMGANAQAVDNVPRRSNRWSDQSLEERIEAAEQSVLPGRCWRTFLGGGCGWAG